LLKATKFFGIKILALLVTHPRYIQCWGKYAQLPASPSQYYLFVVRDFRIKPLQWVNAKAHPKVDPLYNMNLDYYQILGVNPSADLDTIKKAFRRKVMECHPDRGGSHAQMILVNEAWEILSNPKYRQNYDTDRNQAGGFEAKKTAEADAQTARQRAEQYPPQWKDVEPWLNDIFKDFVNTKYGSIDLDPSQNSIYKYWPTAGNSATGWLFIIISAVVFFFGAAYRIYDLVLSKKISGINLVVAIVLFWLPLWIGAWVGAWIHMLISEVLKNSVNEQKNRAQTEPPAESTSGKKVIACDKCGQKLRVPSMQTELWVTCRSCGHKFACPPA
jgi:curved DNA-binding protein CbpA